MARINIRRTTKGRAKVKTLRVLLDSGSSATIINRTIVKSLRIRKDVKTEWTTAAGNVVTNSKCKIAFCMPELSPSATFHWDAHVHDGEISTNYDMLIGRDMLNKLGIDLCFSTKSINWPESHIQIPMRTLSSLASTSLHVEEPQGLQADAERISRITEAKYSPADLEQIARETKGLNVREQSLLLRLLREHEEAFDGTLGEWKGAAHHIHLKDDAQPYHAKPFPVPKAYEQTLKEEVNRLCAFGVLKKVNHSEWAAPSFIIPKKDGSVRFINDFRELNKRIKRMPYPLPKIQDVLLKLEKFTYATSLDLNMGYYHIRLDAASRKLCTLIFPWGKYEMQSLPMGLCNSPDIFQEKMSELMQDLEYVRAYIDDLLIVTRGSYEDHLEKVNVVLQRLRETGLKVNAKKSFFAQTSLEYLGYWVTKDGIQPLPKKVAALQNIAAPKNRKELRSFIGMINYYRDVWIRRSDILAPLTALTSKNVKWRWTEQEQKAFDTIKRVIAHEVAFAFPDFTKPFEIHTDASKTQLGAAISQNGKPIAFYSRKLNKAQLNYTTTERELLAIVETLREFRNILLGQQIIVYTDHQNLTYKVFNTERVMRWRLLIEEYGPVLKYVKGSSNVVADALSRLALTPSCKSDPDEAIKDMPSERALAEAFAQTGRLEEPPAPISFKRLQAAQKKDKTLLKLARTHKEYAIRPYPGSSKHKLIYHGNQIAVPKALQQPLVHWYHDMLCHPGENRTELSIKQHFHWPGLRKSVETVCKHCDICQRTKRTKKNYGHLPAKNAETIPWQTLCIDLIGEYEIPRKGKSPLKLWALTMIDPATGWFEIVSIDTKRANVVANKLEQAWLVRYPWPSQVTCDRGNEFLAEVTAMLVNDYNIKIKRITKRNPQANAIIERVHKTIGNMIRTFSVQDMDEDDPWAGILSAVAFAVRASVHTTMRATPTQLVFGRDAMLPIPHAANWRYIAERKQSLINKNNQRENLKRLPYNYSVGDQVLVKAEQRTKYGTDAYLGPYIVSKVNDNGTLRLRLGAVTDTYNIRIVTPYFAPLP